MNNIRRFLGMADRTTISAIPVPPPPAADEREFLISNLLSAATMLARANVCESPICEGVPRRGPGRTECADCGIAALNGNQGHLPSCTTARVLELIERIRQCAPVTTEPVTTGKETAQDETEAREGVGIPPYEEADAAGEDDATLILWAGSSKTAGDLGDLLGAGLGKRLARRIACAVNFCALIPTETLETQKPLVALTRDIQEQIYAARILGKVEMVGKRW